MATVKRAKRWPNAAKKTKKKKAEKPKKQLVPAKPEPPPELRPFQREGVDFLKKHKWNVILADAPGAGKTPQALIALKENEKRLTPALIVVPSSVARNWKKEAKRWCPRLRSQLVDGTKKKIRPYRHITITTWDLMAYRQDDFATRGYKCIIADEAHYAKNPDTRRSMALARLAEGAKHLLLLTGTPLVNDPQELEELKNLYGEKVDDPPILRRLLADVAPDIPPKQRVTMEVTLPRDIRREYDEVVEEYGDWLEKYLPKLMGVQGAAIEEATDRALAAEPLSKLSYLRRVIGRGKVPAAAAWARQKVRSKEPVVIFGCFNDVMSLLGQALSKLGIAYVRLDGTCSVEQRQAAVDAFQSGEIDVFLGTQAAKEGITLHRARHLLFLERWYTSIAEEQAEDRIRRIGQTRPTAIWYLQGEGTIDERISDIVERKREMVDDVVGLENIPHTYLDTVFDQWKRLKSLRGGTPTVAANPTAKLDLPKLPKTRYVHAVYADITLVPLDALQRHLRAHGYRQRKIKRRKSIVRIECRSRASFRDGRVRTVQVAPGIYAQVGKPAKTDASRMKATRKVKTARRVTTRPRKKKWGA